MEADWKRFRQRVPEWRERYLRRRNEEIVALLTAEGKTPSKQFWAAKERMDEEADALAKCLDGHSRSSMLQYFARMYGYGLIGDADLEEFSEDVREHVLVVTGRAGDG